MKKTYYLLIVLLALAIVTAAYALTPEEMLLLKKAGVPDEKIIEMQKKEASPSPQPAPQISYFDWNDDGKKDIVSGSNSGGFYVYINTGTNQQPIFDMPKDISVVDVRGYSVPYMVDWNNDGKKDVVLGTKAGEVFVFINKGDNKRPIFTEEIQLNKGALDVGSYSAPSMADLNGDGKKDLIVGNMIGLVYVFYNMGEDYAPAFYSDPDVDTRIAVPGYAKPFTVDWNNDGKVDVICGSSDGKVYIFINEGDGKYPKFGKPQTLQVNNKELNLLSRTSVIALDWDDDGKTDLLISNSYDYNKPDLQDRIETGIYLLMNTGTKEKPEFKELKRIKGKFRGDTAL